MSNYSMEELIPIVATLSVKFTSMESSSISYERAQQLMGAVLYCINEVELNPHLFHALDDKRRNARMVYQIGYQMVCNKIEETKNLFNKMIVDFDGYGNENYKESVTGGIPGFFRLYDAEFAPQDTIITMDYPTITPIQNLQGIDAISKYVEYISIEQQFLSILQKDYIYDVLFRYQCSYQEQFYNICCIILRHVLVKMLFIKEHIKREDIEKEIACFSKDDLVEKLRCLLKAFIDQKFKGNDKMFQYMISDCEEFAVELLNGAKYHHLKEVVVI